MSIELYLDDFRAQNRSIPCALFQAAAHDTWQRIAFCRRVPGLKIHETTITQNLVYELNLIKHRRRLRSLRIEESLDEKANGYDLQVIVHQSDGWYTYNIQSKIIYHPTRRPGVDNLRDGTYRQLPHRVGRLAQVDILRNYANDPGHEAIPLYMFYNYVSRHLDGRQFCGTTAQASQFGCCLAGAHRLQQHYSDSRGHLRRNVRFSELYDAEDVIPWLVLTCCLPRYSNRQTRALFKIPPNYAVPRRSYDPSERDGRWTPLREPEKIVEIPQSFAEQTYGFAPRYRVIIDAQGS